MPSLVCIRISIEIQPKWGFSFLICITRESKPYTEDKAEMKAPLSIYA